MPHVLFSVCVFAYLFSRFATATTAGLFYVVMSSVDVGALVCDTLPTAVNADTLLFRATDEVSA